MRNPGPGVRTTGKGWIVPELLARAWMHTPGHQVKCIPDRITGDVHVSCQLSRLLTFIMRPQECAWRNCLWWQKCGFSGELADRVRRGRRLEDAPGWDSWVLSRV